MSRADRSYKDLKQKQKSAIADKTYRMYLKFYLVNQRMPTDPEKDSICRTLFTSVYALAPRTEYDSVYEIKGRLYQVEEKLNNHLCRNACKRT